MGRNRVVRSEVMRGFAIFPLVLVLAACSGEKREYALDNISRKPVSVRGWVDDVAGAKKGETTEMEIARRQEMFAQTSVWVEGITYVTGGFAENGAFVMLDVPPGDVTIGFNAPGAETATMKLQNIPPSADVLLPNVILKPKGSSFYDPKQVLIRVPGNVKQLTPTGQTAIVGGHTVPVYYAPVSQLTDRREYPDTGGIPAPVAIYK